jgi:hypothetical protein
MDYLPIQASAIPCKCIFSLSAKTDTKWRNHIGPLLMEALQMLKFHLKKLHLNFTEAWIIESVYMLKDDLDKDSNNLAVLLKPDFWVDLDQILLSINNNDQD